jgi:membrane-associated protease RseP (regulator of RpoE activity)
MMARLAFCLVVSVAASLPVRAADDIRHDEKGTYLGILFGPRPAPSPGVVVTHVLPGSPAEKARVRIGDVLLRYDQITIRDAEHLARLIRADKPDRKIALVVQRGERLRLTDVTLALGPALKLSPPQGAAASKTTAPSVTVYASPLAGGKMRLTIEYQPAGGKKKTVTCDGTGPDLADAVEKLPPRERNLVRIAIERLNTLNEPKSASDTKR